VGCVKFGTVKVVPTSLQGVKNILQGVKNILQGVNNILQGVKNIQQGVTNILPVFCTFFVNFGHNST
jgi:hypothetical protein